jgi:hypothetical protein
MKLRRSVRRLAAIGAMLAIALQALWPLVSHAQPKGRTLFAPLCTVDGATHLFEIKAGKSTPLEERSAQHGEHCKLCVFGSDRDAVQQARIVAAPVAPATNGVISIFALSFVQTADLLTARPRAPPHAT